MTIKLTLTFDYLKVSLDETLVFSFMLMLKPLAFLCFTLHSLCYHPGPMIWAKSSDCWEQIQTHKAVMWHWPGADKCTRLTRAKNNIRASSDVLLPSAKPFLTAVCLKNADHNLTVSPPVWLCQYLCSHNREDWHYRSFITLK